MTIIENSKWKVSSAVPSDPCIMWTTDYDSIATAPWDREINEGHVEALMSSIQERNLLFARPCIVMRSASGKLLNIDGKHRKEACKRLGIALPYVVVDAGAHVAALLNSTSRGWEVNDFIKFYSELGYDDYMWISNLSKNNGISLTRALNATTGTTARHIKAGNLKLSDSDKSRAINVLITHEALNSVDREQFGGVKDVQALRRIFTLSDEWEREGSVDAFDPDRLVSTVARSAAYLKSSKVGENIIRMMRVYKFGHRKNGFADFVISKTMAGKSA